MMYAMLNMLLNMLLYMLLYMMDVHVALHAAVHAAVHAATGDNDLAVSSYAAQCLLATLNCMCDIHSGIAFFSWPLILMSHNA